MSLPDKTLCWVQGPPWDRTCVPVPEYDRKLEEIEEAADEAYLVLTHIDRMRMPQECVALAEKVMHFAGRESPGIFDVREPSS